MEEKLVVIPELKPQKMVKKVSQASLKISKNEKKKQKQELNCLIKVLKPKVYIIDRSNFKSLVQELTGNGNNTTTTQDHTKPAAEPVLEKSPVVIDVEDDHYNDHNQDHPLQEAAVSMDASVDSSEWCNYYCPSFGEDQQLVQTSYDMIYLDDSQQTDNLFAYNDQSWMFDVVEPSPNFCNGFAQIEQEVSIYDYELFGLI